VGRRRLWKSPDSESVGWGTWPRVLTITWGDEIPGGGAWSF
jgi:hypothetical protein